MRLGWGIDFVRAAYRRWFQLGQETGSKPNVSESLRDIGVEPQAALALANGADAKNALRAETEIASELGIFGSPTFVIGRELFWGDDRLADTISWYKRGLGLSAATPQSISMRQNTQGMERMDIPEPDSLGG
jgi:2-hydroxychromene-2-carboxylate isomerase